MEQAYKFSLIPPPTSVRPPLRMPPILNVTQPLSALSFSALVSAQMQQGYRLLGVFEGTSDEAIASISGTDIGSAPTISAVRSNPANLCHRTSLALRDYLVAALGASACTDEPRSIECLRARKLKYNQVSSVQSSTSSANAGTGIAVTLFHHANTRLPTWASPLA